MASAVEKYLCACCPPVACPDPSWTWRYKTATLIDWFTYSNADYTVAPTDCDVLCGRYGALVTSYAYDYHSPLPDPSEYSTWETHDYVGTLTFTETINPFTGESEIVHTGSATFTDQGYSSDGSEWTTSGDPAVWTIEAREDGTGWDWDWTDDGGTTTDSGTISDLEGSPANIEDVLDPDGGGPPFIFGTGDITDSWVGTAGIRTQSWESSDDYSGTIVSTRELQTLWTGTTLEAAASDYFDEISWIETGTNTSASRSITFQTTDCGGSEEERPNCVATWSETIMALRPTIDAGHIGTWFQIDWDFAKTLDDDTVTLSAQQWEWVSPASKTGPWSTTQQLPADEYGEIEAANVRFICFDGGFPQNDTEFPDIEATE